MQLKSVSKEIKTMEKFIQCSLKISFQGQKNPQICKNPNKIIPCKV